MVQYSNVILIKLETKIQHTWPRWPVLRKAKKLLGYILPSLLTNLLPARREQDASPRKFIYVLIGHLIVPVDGD